MLYFHKHYLVENTVFDMSPAASRDLFAYVILPYEDEFNDLYTDVIMPVLEGVGYRVQRAENVFAQRSSLKPNVLNLQRADFVLADLSLPSPSVFYILGIAQGLLKPTVLITQRIERMPADLRSHRVLEYSTSYKNVDRFKEALREVADAYRSGLLDYAVIADIAPRVGRGRGVREIFAADGTPIDETQRTMPTIYELAVEAVQAMEIITVSARRISEFAEVFVGKSSEYSEQIKALRALGINGSPADLRAVLAEDATLTANFAQQLAAEAPVQREAWERLLRNTSELITTAAIEDSDDREAAQVFGKQLNVLRDAVGRSLTAVRDVDGCLSRTPNISKTLNYAVKHARMDFEAVLMELSSGHSALSQMIARLDERLNGPSVTQTAEVVPVFFAAPVDEDPPTPAEMFVALFGAPEPPEVDRTSVNPFPGVGAAR